MREKNRQRLLNALAKLPQHDPPAHAWQGIDRGLAPPLSERLPAYQPPAGVWNAVSAELAQTQEPDSGTKEQSSPRTRQIPRYWWAAAASLFLVFTLGYGLFPAESGPTITYAHTREVAPASVTEDWNEDENSFHHVLAQLDQIDEPELNSLRMELDELTEAKQEVTAMLVAYGEDPRVVRQLAEIERDRSDVYRRIIVLL